MPEFDVLKVAALKLFHPTVSSVLSRTGFGNCDMVSGEREGVRGGTTPEQVNGFLPKEQGGEDR